MLGYTAVMLRSKEYECFNNCRVSHNTATISMLLGLTGGVCSPRNK